MRQEERRAAQAAWRARLAATTADANAADFNAAPAAATPAAASLTARAASESAPPSDAALVGLGAGWRGEAGLAPQLLVYGNLGGALPWARQVNPRQGCVGCAEEKALFFI